MWLPIVKSIRSGVSTLIWCISARTRWFGAAVMRFVFVSISKYVERFFQPRHESWQIANVNMTRRMPQYLGLSVDAYVAITHSLIAMAYLFFSFERNSFSTRATGGACDNLIFISEVPTPSAAVMLVLFLETGTAVRVCRPLLFQVIIAWDDDLISASTNMLNRFYSEKPRKRIPLQELSRC